MIIKSTNQLMFYIPVVVVLVAIATLAATLLPLYNVHIEEEKNRLRQIVKSQARLIEAVAEFDAKNSSEDHVGGAFGATLSQVITAHRSLGGFGKTGEFVIGKRIGDNIGILKHFTDGRESDFIKPDYPANLMRKAILGQNGVEFSIDYRGNNVLAAFEPVSRLEIGLVAKMDNSEINSPFIFATGLSAVVSIVLLFVGVLTSRRLTRPVAERAALLNKIQKSEVNLAEAQALAHLGNWSLDFETGKEVWSDEQCRIFGYDPKTITPSYDLFVNALHPDDKSRVLEIIDKARSERAPYDIEFKIVRPNGENRIVAVQGKSDFNEAGELRSEFGTVQDITDRKTLEANLIQASKMSTLGEMATGVAHELNQPLNIIGMAASNIQRRLNSDRFDINYLDGKIIKILEQVKRASAIIDHMKIFGRKPNEQPTFVTPSEIVYAVLGMIGDQLRLSNIIVETEINDADIKILGNQVTLEQVLLNLIINARDALKESGTTVKKIIIRISQYNADNILIDVEDTAGGVDPYILEKIFDPFFTTKDTGDGTGLGLSISYGIVNEMGGSIEVFNTDNGACFRMLFPISKEATTA